MRGKVLGLGLAVVLAGAVGCKTMDSVMDKGNTFPVQVSGDIPAAQARVNVKAEEGGNKKVKLEVDHINPPQSLDPEATTFVVWIKPDNGRPQNVGVMQVKENRKAEFETTTPYEKFDIFVTAERQPNAQTPREQPVMRATVEAPARGTY